MATFNISHSTIAALNLGTVFGDLTASVQNLTDQGQEKVAEVIRRLTEEITASKELQNAQRKELLEHLSFISTEIALPRERRKMGPLNSSVAFLKTSLGAVAELATLLPMAEQALKAAGVFTSS